MAVQYDLKEQERVYEGWAKIYDAIYVKLLEPAQRRVAERANAIGGRMLEVGVGTGLALRYYRADAEVVGIDLSVPMLRKAKEKADGGLRQVIGLAAMDACRLAFPNESFDVVTVPFVITLVPDPEGALTEIARVLKPGGAIVIASRFGAEAGLQAKVEETIAPLVKKVGWSSSFKVSRIAAWATANGTVDIEEVVDGLYFKVLRLKKRKVAALPLAA
jgi:phosphatidylethanolamine/phosphatidyl-N-methylethanolamine N-methyltransferase